MKVSRVTVVSLAAVLALAVACGDGDGQDPALPGELTQTPSPIGGDETAIPTSSPTAPPEASPTPPAARAATAVHRFEVPAPIPDPATLPVADCWFVSVSSDREDAFRCMSPGSFISDPCFLDSEAMIVACPSDPRDEGMTAFARWGGASGSPEEIRAQGGIAGPERAWFLVLDAPGDPTCRIVTGTGFGMALTRRMDFDCGAPCSSPVPTYPRDLVVYCYPGAQFEWNDEDLLEAQVIYPVTEAWY